MSMYCEEAADVYDERKRRARVEHICCACKETIRPGDVYNVTAVVFDGTARTFKRCLRCQAIHEHLRTLGDGDCWPDERLDCGEEYTHHWGREPPPEIAALAFALPGEVA
jgi:hypothetical protein